MKYFLLIPIIFTFLWLVLHKIYWNWIISSIFAPTRPSCKTDFITYFTSQNRPCIYANIEIELYPAFLHLHALAAKLISLHISHRKIGRVYMPLCVCKEMNEFAYEALRNGP